MQHPSLITTLMLSGCWLAQELYRVPAFSCPAHLYSSAGGGRQELSIKPGKKIVIYYLEWLTRSRKAKLVYIICEILLWSRCAACNSIVYNTTFFTPLRYAQYTCLISQCYSWFKALYKSCGSYIRSTLLKGWTAAVTMHVCMLYGHRMHTHGLSEGMHKMIL